MGLISIAKLAGLVLASGSTGRDDGTVETSLRDDVDLNGRIAAGVINLAGVNFGDRHDEVIGSILGGGMVVKWRSEEFA